MAKLSTKLKRAIDGLLFPSETDEPLHIFVWSDQDPISPEALLASLGKDAATPVQTTDLKSFFHPVTTPHEWDGPIERKQLRKFTALRDLLEANLSDIVVYKVGTLSIDAYVVGRAADGTYTGISTKVVET